MRHDCQSSKDWQPSRVGTCCSCPRDILQPFEKVGKKACPPYMAWRHLFTDSTEDSILRRSPCTYSLPPRPLTHVQQRGLGKLKHLANQECVCPANLVLFFLTLFCDGLGCCLLITERHRFRTDGALFRSEGYHFIIALRLVFHAP